jgi:hypothetical protein
MALGRSTDDQFDRATIRKFVSGWAPKLLNSAGRKVLIKAICQAIPTSMTAKWSDKNICVRRNIDR